MSTSSRAKSAEAGWSYGISLEGGSAKGTEAKSDSTEQLWMLYDDGKFTV